MTVGFRNYTKEAGFTVDFHNVRDFLIRINSEEVITPGFLWGRWEWAFSLPYLDTDKLSKIGIWEDNGKIVALATYELELGSAYFCVDKRYNFLKREMLIYAKENLAKSGEFKAIINDTDIEFQRIAASLGLKSTQEKEANSVIEIVLDKMEYTLPHGYRIQSIADNFDLSKFNRILWRGFDHDGEPPKTEEQMLMRKHILSGPHLNPKLNIVVISPDGQYASYCGAWYDTATSYALIEPVATDPNYRMKGLGKAAVLESIKRCCLLGAKKAYVGSDQQFYYQIGFYPMPNDTWWI
ncbi:MAG TPA: GNAT family N-acetyltransferase [Bacillota bacterium]|nr:GNAT family N-acetyltransferase [Bacillota bacterium]